MKTKTLSTIKTPNPSAFLGYLHSFRGFAIINIVLIHAVGAAFYGAFGLYDENHMIIIINEVLFHDSTLYFAIISGLLFSKILRPKGYLKFYKSKFNYIVLPYIFITLIFTLFKMDFSNGGDFINLALNYFTSVFIDLVYGKANFVLWYIPVLMFLYVVTPLLDYLLKTNKYTKFLFVILVIMPLFVSRIQMANDYVLKLETLVYFMGAYAVGMYMGSHLDATLLWIKTNRIWLWVMILLSSSCLFYLYFQEIDKIGFMSLRESVFYIQKLCLTGISILFFKETKIKQPKWLHRIAGDSFSIYFMHGFLLYAFLPYIAFLLKPTMLYPFNIILGTIILLIFSIVMSRIIILLFRLLFGKNSRKMIGA
jgi:surface polysaccharide O-acyltransferase-like enzyme